MVKIVQDPFQTFRHIVEVKPGAEISWTLPHPETGVPLLLVGIEKVDENLSREYSSFVEIAMDLHDAVDALDRMCEFNSDSDKDIRNAFFSEAVVSYCRPFNKGYGRGAQLHDSAPWILDNVDEKKWHKEITNIRNKIIAHSDRNHPFRQIKCYIAADTFPKPTYVAVGQMKYQLSSIGNDDAASVKAHILVVAERVGLRISELANQITKKFIQLRDNPYVKAD